MLQRFSSLMLIVALVCALVGNSTFAANPADPATKSNLPDTRAEAGEAPKKGSKPNERLRTGMVKLLADAKAGKVAPAARPQIQPSKSNNLSKGAKIAIGVGIAVLSDRSYREISEGPPFRLPELLCTLMARYHGYSCRPPNWEIIA